MSAAMGPMHGAILRLALLAEARQAQYADAANRAKTDQGRAANDGRSTYYSALSVRLWEAVAITRQGVKP